ncbi:hypothetical protein MMC31_004938 [Peltigera leucophlebia]|nr:hypothetical protein [Peltigera leucophlebia]
MIDADGMLESALEHCKEATPYLLYCHQLPLCLRPRPLNEFVIAYVSIATFRRQKLSFFLPESTMSTKTAACTAFWIQMVFRMRCAGAIAATTKSPAPLSSGAFRMQSMGQTQDVPNASTTLLYLTQKLLTTKPSRQIIGS